MRIGTRVGRIVVRSASWFGASALCTLACAALVGCSSSTEPATTPGILDAVQIAGPYTLTAKNVVSSTPDLRFNYSVVVTNSGASAEAVDYGGCTMFLRLFKTPDRSGTPVFDDSMRNLVCTAELVERNIMPGDSVVITNSIGANDLTIEGVPAGHYYIDLLVAPNNKEIAVAAGEIDVPL